jgi:hypothetical protein
MSTIFISTPRVDLKKQSDEISKPFLLWVVQKSLDKERHYEISDRQYAATTWVRIFVFKALLNFYIDVN